MLIFYCELELSDEAWDELETELETVSELDELDKLSELLDEEDDDTEEEDSADETPELELTDSKESSCILGND